MSIEDEYLPPEAVDEAKKMEQEKIEVERQKNIDIWKQQANRANSERSFKDTILGRNKTSWLDNAHEEALEMNQKIDKHPDAEVATPQERMNLIADEERRQQRARQLASKDDVDNDYLIDSTAHGGETVNIAEIKEEYPEDYQEIRARLQNRRLIDLGCGVNPNSEAFFAAVYGSSAFVGVDKYYKPTVDMERYKKHLKNQFIRNSLQNRYKDADIQQTEKNLDGMGIETLQDDMLVYLSRLPDDSVNVLMTNIDGFIIRDDEYYDALTKEISRVIGTQGLFISKNAPSLHDPSITFVKQSGHYNDGIYFRKNSNSESAE